MPWTSALTLQRIVWGVRSQNERAVFRYVEWGPDNPH